MGRCGFLGRGGGLLGWSGRGVGRGATGGLDLGDHGADPHRLALGDRDLDELAFEGGGDLGVDLVRDDLHDRLVAFYEVTLALEPLLDRALGHRLAELGHLDLGQAHALSPRLSVDPSLSSATSRQTAAIRAQMVAPVATYCAKRAHLVGSGQKGRLRTRPA